jgi:hypothetical protein
MKLADFVATTTEPSPTGGRTKTLWVTGTACLWISASCFATASAIDLAHFRFTDAGLNTVGIAFLILVQWFLARVDEQTDVRLQFAATQVQMAETLLARARGGEGHVELTVDEDTERRH